MMLNCVQPMDYANLPFDFLVTLAERDTRAAAEIMRRIESDPPTKSVKHGDHDQSDHGNWAHGGASDRSGGNVARYIRAHGLQTTVSNGPVPDMRDKERAMWKIKKDTMNNSTLHWDHRNDTPEMRAVRLQERQIEWAATILAQGYKGMREVPNDNWRVIEMFAPDGSLAAAAMGTLQDQGDGEKAFAMRFFGSLGTVEGAGTAIMAKALEIAADANAEFRLIKVQEGSHAWYQQWGFDTMGTSGAPDMSKEKVAEWVANYRAAATKFLKHGDHDQSDHGNWARGGSAEAGDSKDNPIRTSDVEEAARALGEGKHVQLSSPDQVATLLDRLNELAKEAEAAGSKAKNIDLCNVTVPGTNLFCVESKGIPRVEMPQLKGIPNAGSPASDLVADKRGEVDITEAYLEQLRSSGVTLEEDEALASHLKATQNELNGNKVAGIMASARAGELDLNQPIVVSRDGYIVDGHHRWAAKVALEHDGIDDPETDMKIPVVRVDQDILDILESSKQFAADMGLPQVAVKFLKHGDHDQSDHGNWAHGEAPRPTLSAEDKTKAEELLLQHLGGRITTSNYQNAFQLTDLEVAAFSHYGGFGYMEINNLLRGEGSDWGMAYAPEVVRAAELLESAMEKASLQTDTKLYRGMHLPTEEANKLLASLKPGQVYTDPAFTSTSKSEKVASGFALDRAPDDRAEDRTSIIWEMFAPAGTSALDYDKLFPTSANTEKEVLLASDTHFRILGTQREGYTSHGEPIIRVTATVIPTGTQPVKHADHDQSDHGNWATGKSPQFNEDENGAITIYQDQGHMEINRYLRGTSITGTPYSDETLIKKWIASLDSAITTAGPTTRPMTIYRGISGRHLEELRKGGVFEDLGFASFSKSGETASEFATGAAFGFIRKEGAVLELDLPAGSFALDMESHSMSTEQEVLLPRGSRFELISGPEELDLSNEEDNENNRLPVYQVRLVPPTKSIKHGDHDQSEHGNWARGGADHQYTGEPRSASSRERMNEHIERYGSPERRESGRKSGSRNLGREVTYMEIVALESYKGGGYGEINRYLRGFQEGDDWTKDRVDAVKALAMPTTEPMTVTRMMDLFAVEGIAAGQVYEDKGFMSTGKGDHPAQFFHGYPVQMQIEVPAGTPVVDFDNFSGLDGWGNIEREVTLMPNTQLQIDRVEQRNWNRDFGPTETDGLMVYARLIPATKSYKHADHDQSDHGNWADKQDQIMKEDEERAKNDPWKDSPVSRSDAYASVNYYSDFGYVPINRFLRKSDGDRKYTSEDDIMRHVKNIDAMFSMAAPLKEDLKVFRGVSWNVGRTMTEGSIFTDAGYTSTSRNSITPWNFMSGESGREYMMEITIPAGSKVVNVEVTNEAETLLPRGSQFQITGLRTDTGITIVEATLINSLKSLKHADHDQSDHGNWANGSVPLAKTPLDQVDALRQWSSNSYSQVNNALRDPNAKAAQERGGTRELWQKTQDGLDRLFEGVPPTTRPWTLYRGASGEFVMDIVKQYDSMIAKMAAEYQATGTTPTSFVLPRFTDNGFVSTTPDKDVAMNFSGAGVGGGPFYGGDGRAIFEINLPEGSKMVNVEEYVNEFGGFAKFAAEESEFLLPRGLTFEVTDVTPSDEQIGDTGPLFYNIRLDVVPSSTKSFKHADHDQSDHGNWAHGGGLRSEESRQLFAKDEPEAYLNKNERETLAREWSTKLGRQVTQLDVLSLDNYKRWGSVELNQYLRGQSQLNRDRKEYVQDRVDGIKNLAKPLDRDIVVYRWIPSATSTGEPITKMLQKAYEDGTVVSDSGFMSTSTEVTGGQAWGKNFIAIEVPAGTPVVDFNDWIPSLNAEKEILLMPDTEMMLTYGETLQDGSQRFVASVVSPKTKSLKHGDHDQSDHGNWARGFDAPSSSVPTPADSKTTVPLWWHERDKTVSLDNMRNGMEAQVREALDAYTHWSADDGYDTGTRLAFHAALNERLRAGDSRFKAVETVARLFAEADDEDLVRKLGSGFMYVDSALSDSKVIKDMTVTRASSPIMSIDELEAAAKGAPLNLYGQEITPGAVYSDAGIVSTSADMSYQSTQFFAQNWEDTESLEDWQVPTTVRWNIKLPAGAPALDLRALEFQSQHGESEVLLPRNTHFQIDEVNVELPKFDGAPAKVTVNATVIPTHSTTKP